MDLKQLRLVAAAALWEEPKSSNNHCWVLECGCDPQSEHCEQCDGRRKLIEDKRKADFTFWKEMTPSAFIALMDKMERMETVLRRNLRWFELLEKMPYATKPTSEGVLRSMAKSEVDRLRPLVSDLAP